MTTVSPNHIALPVVAHRRLDVDGVQVAYRETGPADGPPLLLLHGFPSSSHQYSTLMVRLGDRVHCIAPDLPGFGETRTPEGYRYTFDGLADTIEGFVAAIGLRGYSMYVFDFGAPVGLRVATRNPEQVIGLITQNGNAYTDGFGPAVPTLTDWWADPVGQQHAIDQLLTLEGTRWQYLTGVRDETAVDPANYRLDHYYLELPGRRQAMIDLLWDYRNNPPAYPAFQRWLRDHQPAVLAAWGRNDPFFTPAGAEAYRRDVPTADIHLLDTGHFALEEDLPTIAALVSAFVAGLPAVR